MKRALAWAGAAAVAGLVLTGCVRTTVDTTISSDDTFSQHSILAFNDTVAAQVTNEVGFDAANLAEELESAPEFIELQERFPGQIEVADYYDGELHGAELTLTDIPLEEFSNAATQAGTGLTGGATLTREGDTFVVEMSFPDTAGLEDIGVSESQLELLAGSLDIGVSYTFPGPVQSATAGTIEGHTVTLGLADIASGQDVRIVASAGDSIDWGPILTWGGVGLAFLLVIGGATALIIQDRRKSLRNTLPPHQTTDTPTGPGLLGETPAPGNPRIGPQEGFEPDNR